jgi:hypothetical protein
MTDITREDSTSNINTFLNLGHIKTVKEIDNYLLKELSSYEIQYIDYFNNWNRQWPIENLSNYSKYLVRIYFPKENLCIICSQSYAYDIPVVKNILEENFKEKAISFRYFDPELKKIMDGPIIIILLKTETSSIILEDGKSIKEHCQNIHTFNPNYILPNNSNYILPNNLN